MRNFRRVMKARLKQRQALQGRKGSDNDRVWFVNKTTGKRSWDWKNPPGGSGHN